MNTNHTSEVEKGESHLKQIIQASSLISGFLVFCGALYLYLYYFPLQINIFKYLEIGEVLITAIYIIIPSGVEYAYNIIIAIIFILIFGAIIKSISYRFQKYRDRLFMILDIWNVVLIIISIIYIYVISKENLHSNKYYLLQDVRNYFILISLVTTLLQLQRNKIKYTILAIIIIAPVVTSFQAYTDRQVKVTNWDETVVITTDKDTITTNSHNIYFGRTTNYVFLYDKIDRTRNIIPSNTITKITFKKIQHEKK